MKQPLISLILLFLSFSGYANTTPHWTSFPEYQSILCKSEFEKLFNESGWNKETYREQVADHHDQKNFISESRVIGVWNQFEFRSKRSPEIIKILSTKLEKVSFDEKCKPVIAAEKLPWVLEKAFASKHSDDFNDESLKNLVSSGKKGVIYTWSPKFVYSVYDVSRLEKLVHATGFEFTALVDPRVSRQEAIESLRVADEKNNQFKRSLASEKYLSRNISMDIYMRDGFNHYPVMFIYNNKKIHKLFLTGIMRDQDILNMMNRFAKELN